MLYLVDDLHSLKAADWPDGEYWSTSTGLPYLLPSGTQLRSPEEFVDNALYQSFGRAVLDAQLEARGHFAKAEQESSLTDLAVVYAPQFYVSLLCICYKALLLDRWLAFDTSTDKTVIGCSELMAPGPGTFQFGRHEHLFASLASQLGGRVSAMSVPAIGNRHFSESFNAVPAFDKTWNILNRTGSSIAYKLVRRFLGPVGSGRSGTLLIGIENDSIEESFLQAFARGWRIVKVDLCGPTFHLPESITLVGLKRALTSTILKYLGSFMDSALLRASSELLLDRMQDAIAYHPAFVKHYDTQVRQWLDAYEDSNQPVVFLTSGLYSPAGRILDGSLRRHGIPVVCTDHGVGGGLGLRHDYTATDAISFSDHYFAFNREIASLYSQHRCRATQRVTATQVPAIMRRSNFPKIQRAASRKYLGLERNERVLIYVANLALNNVPIGYGTATDREYATFQLSLVQSLATFPGRVVIKPYPAHRYADPEQIWQMPLPANAILSPFGEYRHIRWAADVVLLDLCSSTFGWAVNCNTPLFYVDNLSGLMSERAVEAAKESVFYFSSMENGWEQSLRASLELPQEDLVSTWLAMADAREDFIANFVNGGDMTLTEGLLNCLDEISQ